MAVAPLMPNFLAGIAVGAGNVLFLLQTCLTCPKTHSSLSRKITLVL